MKELITTEQANTVMLALIIVLPIIGAALGSLTKRALYGLKWGIGIGLCNFILWKLYNSITDNLGLDTVKNLLVNLALFVTLGVVGGLLSSFLSRKNARPEPGANDTNGGEFAVVGGPNSRGPGNARSVPEADQPPRDPG